ncbi:MAG TPA: flagellar biosynthesis anti-sigma factor FlgM [Candidatus Atribacteria bacterium]|nr:flagellar biosynthesis anti-sigma factor FlgM [Candidatus Atribacteria bacterium]
MVIGDGRVGSILKTYLNNVQKTTPSKVKLEKEDNIREKLEKDEVVFSSEAKEFQKMLEELKKLPDVREDKVEYYRKLIDSGEYKVSSDDIVNSIVNFFKGE